jgi:hypothetical protein
LIKKPGFEMEAIQFRKQQHKENSYSFLHGSEHNRCNTCRVREAQYFWGMVFGSL